MLIAREEDGLGMDALFVYGIETGPFALRNRADGISVDEDLMCSPVSNPAHTCS